jgi:hypothetical protein
MQIEISDEMVEVAASAAYGRKWNSPKDEERPGEKERFE